MGLPQLDISWYGNQLFWCLILFSFLFIIIRFYYVTNMSKMFTSREDYKDRYIIESQRHIEQKEENEDKFNTQLNDFNAQLLEKEKKAQLEHNNNFQEYCRLQDIEFKNKIAKFRSNLMSSNISYYQDPEIHASLLNFYKDHCKKKLL